MVTIAEMLGGKEADQHIKAAQKRAEDRLEAEKKAAEDAEIERQRELAQQRENERHAVEESFGDLMLAAAKLVEPFLNPDFQPAEDAPEPIGFQPTMNRLGIAKTMVVGTFRVHKPVAEASEPATQAAPPLQPDLPFDWESLDYDRKRVILGVATDDLTLKQRKVLYVLLRQPDRLFVKSSGAVGDDEGRTLDKAFRQRDVSGAPAKSAEPDSQSASAATSAPPEASTAAKQSSDTAASTQPTDPAATSTTPVEKPPVRKVTVAASSKPGDAAAKKTTASPTSVTPVAATPASTGSDPSAALAEQVISRRTSPRDQTATSTGSDAGTTSGSVPATPLTTSPTSDDKDKPTAKKAGEAPTKPDTSSEKKTKPDSSSEKKGVLGKLGEIYKGNAPLKSAGAQPTDTDKS